MGLLIKRFQLRRAAAQSVRPRKAFEEKSRPNALGGGALDPDPGSYIDGCITIERDIGTYIHWLTYHLGVPDIYECKVRARRNGWNGLRMVS